MYEHPTNNLGQVKYFGALVRLKVTEDFQEFHQNLSLNMARITSELREERDETTLRHLQGATQVLDGMLEDILSAREVLGKLTS